MMKNNRKKERAVLLAALVLALAGCGGSSSDPVPGAAAAPVPSPAPAQNTLPGIAASGKGTLGILFVKDANGVEVNVPIKSTGRFTILTDGLKEPLIVRADPDAGGASFFSYAATLKGWVNVTPLTGLTLFLQQGKTDLASLYAGWATQWSKVKAADLQTAQDVVEANLATRLQAKNVNASSFDLFTSSFAVGDAFDQVLDTVKVALNGPAGTFALNDAAGGVLTFNEAILNQPAPAPVPTPQPDPSVRLLANAQPAGCLNCHAIDRNKLGPAWRDVANRYRNNKTIRTFLINKVINGGDGNWTQFSGGLSSMPRNSVSVAESTALVDDILALP